MKTPSPLRILLVEDDEHDSLAFHRAFEKSSVACEITDCILAEEALLQVLADASLFDVVVIDHKLPGMSGLDLCKELLRKKTPLPLVLLTGRGSQELAIEALKAGVDDYVVKEHGQGYLDLLPVVLPEVLRKHGDRLAREQAEEALRKSHDELEQRVEERTAELAKITEQLKQELFERRRVEESLRLSEERFRSVAQTASDAIITVNSRGNIVFWNHAAEKIFGYSADEAVEKPLTSMMPERFRKDHEKGLKRAVSTGESSIVGKTVEMIGRGKNGRHFPVELSLATWKTKEGVFFTGIVRDITESLARATQLIQASKMSTLGEMATGVAHELSQPLTTIQIGADLIQGMNKEGKQIPDNVLALISEQIIGQVKRAVHIINHLREFGRKVEIQRERLDVNKPIQDVFTLLGRQLKLRDIKVVLDLSEDLPPITGDSIRLEQVFVDLINNARDAMEAKTKQATGVGLDNTLTVRSFQQNGQVVVTITDTGTGIPDNIIDKIFEPFFTTKKVGEGTGLGLSIGYGIIRDYNGTLEVQSKVGEGTTFKISFPAREEDERES